MTDYSEMALVRGMGYLSEAQSSIAHNLANVNSTGFKRQIAVAQPVQDDFATVLDEALPTVRYTQETDWSSGSLNTTGDKLHVALEGSGFFMVDAGNGQRRYTRNGAMLIDSAGNLSNSRGHHFLDDSGQTIRFGPGIDRSTDEITISPDGNIRVRDAVIGRIGVFEPADPRQLSAAGQGMHVDRSATDGAPRHRLASGTRVLQGQLEQSNVDSLRELVQMISIQRSFQASSRALGAIGRVQTAFINAVNR